MYQIKKLSEIKNYRAYQNFKWDESVDLFGKNNIIFGWNASGKSSIADLLFALSSNLQFEDDEQFSILFQNEAFQRLDVKRNQPFSDRFILRVYDQHYTDRNIEKTDTLNHIYSIGEGQISKSRELKGIQAQIEDCKKKVDKTQDDFDKAQKKYDSYLTKTASILKNELNLPSSYNRNHFLIDFEACPHPEKLALASYASLQATILSPVLPTLIKYDPLLVNASISGYIKELLSTQPIIKAIESLRDNAEVSKWAADGLALHKKHHTKKCFFCDNEITDERFLTLEAHFNKEFQDLAEKIRKAQERLSELRETYVRLQLSFYKANQFYPELFEKFVIIQDTLSGDCLKCIETIDQLKEMLASKSSNIVSNDTVFQFEKLIGIHILTVDITKNMNDLIDMNNTISSDHANVVKEAQSRAKKHWFAIYNQEFRSLEQEKENASIEHKKAIEDLSKVSLERQNLILSSSNTSIPATIMNEELASFLGRDEIQFIEQNNGYELRRNGKIARNLSKGEKNAISLVYFLNSLNDINIEKKETIVVLDDPISSFDSNYYYYALAYIRANLIDVGQSLIFTHKFSFYKDLCLVFKNKDEKTRHYIIERDQTGVYFRNESRFLCKYYDEYSYLFNRIIKYATNPSPSNDESLAIANLARKVLESFLTFKVPNNDETIEKVRALSAELNTPSRAMCRILNSKSHLQIIPDQDHGDDIEILLTMQHSIRDMLDFMWSKDPFHFKTLVDNCEDVPEGFIMDGSLHFTGLG